MPKTVLEVDMEEILRLASSLSVPEATYKLALLKKDKTESVALLKEAANAGYVKAQIELGDRISNGKLKEEKLSAEHYYKMASDAGSKKALYKFERRQIDEFKDNFNREPESKEVLITTRKSKERGVI